MDLDVCKPSLRGPKELKSRYLGVVYQYQIPLPIELCHSGRNV
jgi:hypothetical protein